MDYTSGIGNDPIALRIISYGPLVCLWCLKSYPRHPDGCGNYCDKSWCPPQAPVFPDMFDVSNYNIIEGGYSHGDANRMHLLKLKPGEDPTLWLVIEPFNLGEWVRKLRAKTPSMSDAQARIPYLYQDRVRRRLEAKTQSYRWVRSFPMEILMRPEANGVNLFATLRVNSGFQLEKNPMEMVYFISMIGKKADTNPPRPAFGYSLRSEHLREVYDDNN